MNGVKKWESWLANGGGDPAWALAELERKVEELQTTVLTLKHSVAAITATSEVLTATTRAALMLLTELGHLDGDVLSRRVDECIEELQRARTVASHPPSTAPVGGAPYRDTLMPLVGAPGSAPRRSGVCGGCGRAFPLEQMDVVADGTGYRCTRCTMSAEVAGHIEQAIANAEQRGAGATTGGDLLGVAAAVLLATDDD